MGRFVVALGSSVGLGGAALGLLIMLGVPCGRLPGENFLLFVRRRANGQRVDFVQGPNLEIILANRVLTLD